MVRPRIMPGVRRSPLGKHRSISPGDVPKYVAFVAR